MMHACIKGANAPTTEERKMLMAAVTLSAKEAARELGCDSRTFRKFMRAVTPKEDQPGQGNRWHIEQKDIKKLKKQFSDWGKAKRPSANGTKDSVEVTNDEVEITEHTVIVAKPKKSKKSKELVVHDLEDEPTAEDLEALELGDVEDLADIDLDDIELN